jgi:putative nucleotidyltransferase with HDIG domain
MEDAIQAVAATIEKRDPYTAGHQRRVAELATRLAAALGLPEDVIHGIRLTASIHDIGKIHVPAEILSYPGKLPEIEFALIRQHPMVGYEILKTVDFPWPVAEMVYQHHEHLDGSGYPRGLAGDQILPGARIITVADVVEAIALYRPYRPGLGIEAAMAEIETYRDRRYDADVVDACVRLFRQEGYRFP